MESIVTTRIDADLKQRVASVLKEEGITMSVAIRQMFEQIARENSFSQNSFNRTNSKTVNVKSAKKKIASLDSLYVRGFENSTDEEIKQMRMEDRYAAIPRH